MTCLFIIYSNIYYFICITSMPDVLYDHFVQDCKNNNSSKFCLDRPHQSSGVFTQRYNKRKICSSLFSTMARRLFGLTTLPKPMLIYMSNGPLGTNYNKNVSRYKTYPEHHVSAQSSSPAPQSWLVYPLGPNPMWHGWLLADQFYFNQYWS